jgi:hypothetical protein
MCNASVTDEFEVESVPEDNPLVAKDRVLFKGIPQTQIMDLYFYYRFYEDYQWRVYV